MLDFSYFRDLVIAFVMFASAGLGAPFPEEVLIVGAGVWTAAHAEFGPFRWLMLPVCLGGVLLADSLLYGMGRVFGGRLLSRPWVQRMLPPEKRERIEANYDRYGVSILMFGRLVPGVRVPLFLTAGIMRLPIPRFLLADGLGAVLGNSLLYFLAFWFGDSVKDYLEWVKADIRHYRPLLVLVVILVLAAFLLYRLLRQRVLVGDLKKEVPVLGRQIATRIEQRTPPEKAADAGGLSKKPSRLGVRPEEGGGEAAPP